MSWARRRNCALSALVVAAWLLRAIPAWAGQAENSKPEPPLPEAPQPQVSIPAHTPPAISCPSRPGAQPAAATAGTAPGAGQAPTGAHPPACSLPPKTNWYVRFTNGPKVKPMTPKEKGWLAVRNVTDPFNAVTILGSSAITVGSDANSAYGPGMAGFGRAVGVSYTQDITGAFFSTFLIPSVVHQDPHYHRMPDASIERRIAHAIYQVVWTQGDNGKGMVNYADLAGSAIEDEIGNLYVPAQETDLPASAERYGTGLATAPIDNFISEFLPDVARHIHIRVVLIQRIINHVATTSSSGSP